MTFHFVDDSPELLMLYGEIVGNIPHRKSLCPRKALEHLRHTPAHVIVTDFDMQVMNGGQFLAAARQICPDAYLIMITGNSPQDLSLKPEEMPHEHFTKPFDVLALRSRLHSLAAVA